MWEKSDRRTAMNHRTRPSVPSGSGAADSRRRVALRGGVGRDVVTGAVSVLGKGVESGHDEEDEENDEHDRGCVDEEDHAPGDDDAAGPGPRPQAEEATG